MADLKPCPNPECKSEDVWVREAPRYQCEFFIVWHGQIVCDDCELTGPAAVAPEEAARLWNNLPGED